MFHFKSLLQNLSHFKLAPLLGLAMLFLSPHVEAAVTAIVTQNNTAVKAQPSSNAKTLGVLSRGRRLSVVTKRNGWLGVQIKTSSGRVVNGWVPAGTVRRAGSSSPRVSPPPAPSPQRPAPRSAPNSGGVDDFFGGSSKRKSPSRQSSPSTSRASRTSSPSGASGKIKASAELGYIYFSHEVDALSNGFDYPLLGPTVNLRAAYDFWENTASTWKLQAEVFYQMAFLNTQTNLVSASGNQFDSRDQKNRLSDGRILFRYLQNSSEKFSYGLTAGYQYFQFKGDDIKNNADDPLGLYVTHTNHGIVLGPHFRLPLGQLSLSGDLNFIVLSGHSEDPEGSSGPSNTPKIGVLPELRIEKEMGMGTLTFNYRARYHVVGYGGTVTRVEKSLEDIVTRSFSNEISVGYQRSF